MLCIFIIFYSYVWIYLYNNIEDFDHAWTSFSQEEVYVIKTALRGSLKIGLSEGSGTEYQAFADNFSNTSKVITGRDDYSQFQKPLLHTAYAYDAAHLTALALHDTIQKKAEQFNQQERDISISTNDTRMIRDSMTTITFNGFTGNVSINNQGRRAHSNCVIKNFVPIDSMFAVNTSLTLNPWVVQNRAYVEVGVTGTIAIHYINENGSASEDSTIVFADGTTNIPPGRPFRFYERSKMPLFLFSDI